MQKRFTLSTHEDFARALVAKISLRKINEEEVEAGKDKKRNYQIRKFAHGFKVVERLDTNEAAVVGEIRRPKRRKRNAVV